MTARRRKSHALSIVHAGLGEAGSLSAATPLFTMAVVMTSRPHTVANLISRTVLRSGKRLKRRRKLASELKWRNASQRIWTGVLTRLAQADKQKTEPPGRHAPGNPGESGSTTFLPRLDLRSASMQIEPQHDSLVTR